MNETLVLVVFLALLAGMNVAAFYLGRFIANRPSKKAYLAWLVVFFPYGWIGGVIGVVTGLGLRRDAATA